LRDSVPNTVRYGYCHIHSDSHCHVHFYANTYSPESDAYIYSYANANSDRAVQPDADTITDFYTNSDCGTWRN